MEMKENYKTPKWFYRSDDRPMENIGIHENGLFTMIRT